MNLFMTDHLEDIKKIMEQAMESGDETHDTMSQKLQIILLSELDQSFKKLNDSINKASESNESLSNKIFWLNIVLTFATVCMAGFAGYEIFFK